MINIFPSMNLSSQPCKSDSYKILLNIINLTEVNSGASTPSLSPRKELNGRGGGSGGASSGAWSEGEGSSAGASVQGDDESDTQAVLDLLSATRTPQVTIILFYPD